MSFKSEGQYKVTITQAYVGDNKFDENIPVVVIVGETEDGTEGCWMGELSDRYGIGNSADKTQAELTLASLHRIGWELSGAEICDETLHKLIGVKTEFGVKASEKDGKTYYNVRYLGASNFRPRKAGPEAQAKIAALFGGASKPAVVQSKQSNSNPFA